MTKCNTCVNRSDYTDSKDAKDNISNYYNSLTTWCKQQSSTPGTPPTTPPPTPPTTPFVPVPGGGSGTGTGTRPGGVTIGAPPGSSTTGRVNSTVSARPSSVSKL